VIRGYPDAPCVAAGDTLRLHVSTDARRFFVALRRWGTRITETSVLRDLDGHDVAPGTAGQRWQWPEYRIPISSSAIPGVYAAVLQTDRETGDAFNARHGRALFVVRPGRPSAPLLIVLPLFTYHAYNVAHVDGTLKTGDEGECLYSGTRWVTLHRPGGGTGGHPWDEVNRDVYDLESPRQTFVHWDGKALAWLEREGVAYDCCTDLELHDGSIGLSAYRAIASFGHHEYWSQEMRTRVEAFIAEGGNVAFFGGNTCWFEVVYDAQHNAIRRAGRWNEDPEWRLSGVSYAIGGGKWVGERPATGFTVTQPEHWIFERTRLRSGDTFGAREHLAGYECDGAPAESDALVLASASIAHWPREGADISQAARADMTLRQAGGMVFSASTADWARVLERGDPAVEQITRNVLRRFMSA
jgi:hypothetical protein